MKTYNNIKELIIDLPKYKIPYEYLDICWYLKIKINSLYKNITPLVVIKNLQKIFGDFDTPKDNIINEKINSFNNYIVTLPDYKKLRSGKIICYDVKIPENMVRCDNCGNIWSRNPKCNCYLFDNEFGEYMIDIL